MTDTTSRGSPGDRAPLAGCPEFPVTIADWRETQLKEGGLERLLMLAERQSATGTPEWIAVATPDNIEKQWRELEAHRRSQGSMPLWGVPFAVKDNIDAAGFPTTAACPSFAGAPAQQDAPVVARLKAAGAILIGKTNLDQFATGLVGTRSPYGPVPNAFSPSHVSGGSSSGSAVVVSKGAVAFSLGTDTAGSGRVPAGLNNIIGLKPTRGAISARDVVPACRTLDCVSIFAQTIEDAETVLRAAEGFDQQDAYSRLRPTGKPSLFNGRPTVAICQAPPWFGKAEQEEAYRAALNKAEAAGWSLVETDFTPLFALAQLLYEGPWVAERYAAIRSFIEKARLGDMDPVVYGIIVKAKSFSAADAFAGEYRRQELVREIETAFARFDAILVPTTPTFPTMDEVAREPVLENSRLGTYTNFVNFMDWTALSVPAGFRADGLPFGVTLIARRWEEPWLLQLGQQFLAGERRQLGVTGTSRQEPKLAPSTTVASKEGFISVIVVGAHLSGFPLNKDLVVRGASLEQSTTTSNRYRLFSLASTDGVKRPGLKRVVDGEQGAEIEVEVWQLPGDQLSSFISTVPHPLCFGSVELVDGSWKLGFVCEPIGFRDAVEITDFRGWRTYTASLAKPPKRRIHTVLVANRGEIALRIIRTLHAMEIKTVAIFSHDDAHSPHVRSADIACRLEGDTVAETYLNASRIIELAASTSADAIIPGYGFLAENADFAEAVETAGMVWIGPTAEQIRQLGHKHTARMIAISAGVPVIPGSEGLLSSVEDAKAAAASVGYPIMLKSTAGGGGIGLRRCDDETELSEALNGVQRLARANFGDDGVFLEHFIERARHIEVQILGDGTGNILTAGERDCSLQRRHQKVIEESPAPVLPASVRDQMLEAAKKLASSVQYRNVGTVEFIYDTDTEHFYFLEVNTRLQVEHTVTESVTGIDLVEWMVRIADGECERLFSRHPDGLPVNGSSVEARIYSESPMQGFRPSLGQVLDVQFPSNVRIDTWIEKGTTLSSSYDSLVAKIIATGKDRQQAVDRLQEALTATKITGVETNLKYVQRIVSSETFRSGNFLTSSLSSFDHSISVIEVLEPGTGVTVQDYPGRKGYWHVGIPPSGPMDHYSFRLANSLVGNAPRAAALECSFQGPTLRFTADAVIAVTGAPSPFVVDSKPALQNRALQIKAGQTVSLGTAIAGCRTYVAVRGGIDVPLILGSRSTFELGDFGGHNGRRLGHGDILHIGNSAIFLDESLPVGPAIPILQQPCPLWTVGVVPGPHGAPDYFTTEGLSALFAEEWTVHYNSNRLGVRLTGPRPRWARQNGGEAGLHPSNIHDSPYSIGSVSFTGDEAVVLTCDGPSLGGFVVWCVVAEAEMWKMGQVRPGDRVRFEIMTTEEAASAAETLEKALTTLATLETNDIASRSREHQHHTSETVIAVPSAVVGSFERDGQRIAVRQAGECAMLLEFGEREAFDLRQSMAIYGFIEQHKIQPIPGVEELSPGVRTLHVSYSRGIHPKKMLASLSAHQYTVPSSVRSRRFHLPLAFDDTVCRKAVERYTATIRGEAPWLPSNPEFLRQLNGLAEGAVEKMLNEAEFLVLGLGDVFLGSPCAVPLDPRHRLFGTKYNPSRSFTPRGAVGIGGQYLCIYGGESPGGYQLVGRTVPIWSHDKLEYVWGVLPGPGGPDEAQGGLIAGNETGDSAKPWMFRLFDRISFYPVEESQLGPYDTAQGPDLRSLVRVEEDVILDINQYEAWLDMNKDNIEEAKNQRNKAISRAPFLEELLQPYERVPNNADSDRADGEADTVEGEKVRSIMPGKCFKCEAKEGDMVREGEQLVWMESNKMEISICSPIDGKIVKVAIRQGDVVPAASVLFVVAPATGSEASVHKLE